MPTYKEAGVDLDRADRVVESLGEFQAETESAASRKLMGSFGQFASCMDLADYEEPVLVTTCDGVGTKFKLLRRHDRLGVAGWDLVAMNVNDLLTCGADPLMFMDYLAMAPLEDSVIQGLVSGMTEACKSCRCLLAGGETAEMPGMIDPGSVEVSGFCAGAVEKGRLEETPGVQEEDVLVGIPSEGFHANGYSLIREILDREPGDFSDEDIARLLEPTRIYYDEVQKLEQAEVRPAAMVHVTGGGVPGNLSRVLPEDLGARVDLPSWTGPGVDPVLNHVEPEEAHRTFNMGVGWILVMKPDRAQSALNALDDAFRMGTIQPGTIEITRGS